MLSLDRLDGLNGLSLHDSWVLPVTKNFSQPEYYPGQTVWHCMKVSLGEILHPVLIIGLWWTGLDWEYVVELPRSHPNFKLEVGEVVYLEKWELESI